MENNSEHDNCYLREATQSDCEFLFEMANDKDTRLNAFCSEPISYETHIKWFSEKMASNTSKIYIYCDNDKPIGQVRLDYSDQKAVLSYGISKEYRGNGHAKLMLNMLEKHIFLKIKNILKIEALVKIANIPSIRVFEHLLYKKQVLNDIIIFTKIINK